MIIASLTLHIRVRTPSNIHDEFLLILTSRDHTDNEDHLERLFVLVPQ